MEITFALVEKLAHLSRLHIAETEIPQMQADLQKMVAFVEQLREVNTEGVEPLRFMSPNQNVFREDVVKPHLSKSEVLYNVPHQNDNFILVPKVIEQ